MKLVNFIAPFLIEKKAFAHCDIPCGIYDPHNAQVAAHTVIRMTQLIKDLEADINAPFEERKKIIHNISRQTRIKEKHADLLEEELTTLRNDYFKEEHFKEHASLNELFMNTFKSVAKARQEINLQAAEETLENVLQIAEIFYKTKGVEPIRIKSVYPTGKEIVTYK